MKNNYYVSSFGFGVVAKVFDSIVKFISIPLLIKHLGIENYGILTLALATNAYMALLDLGIKTGNVKFFAQWIGADRKDLVDKVARTSITFFGGIGFLNAIGLLFIAFYGENLFNLTPEQFISFRDCLFVLALFSVVDWSTSVFSQVLIADERIVFIQKVELFKTLFYLLLIGLTIILGFSLFQFFTIQVLISSLVFIPYFLLAKKVGLVSSLIPNADWGHFRSVLKYSLAIFSMGIFQMAASQSRPLILGIFSDNGVKVLAEYKIIQVFPAFIITLSGMIISILLPKATKLMQSNNIAEINRFAIKGTKIITIVITILCFPLILCSKEILTLYVGDKYLNLSIWLVLWLINVLIATHNAPVASMVLATGKTKALVFSSFLSFLVSICINILFVNVFHVGSAVLSYSSYLCVQIGFYYFFFNTKILSLPSFKVFVSFIIPALIGVGCGVLVYMINPLFNNLIVQSFVKSALWFGFFMASMQVLRVIDIRKVFLKIKSEDSSEKLIY